MLILWQILLHQHWIIWLKFWSLFLFILNHQQEWSTNWWQFCIRKLQLFISSAHPSWSVMNHIVTTGLYDRIPELKIFHRLLSSKEPQFTGRSMFYLDYALIATASTMQIVKALIRYQPTKECSTWTQQNTWRLASQHGLIVACIASMHLLLPIPITGIMPLVKLIWIIWQLYLANTLGKLSFRSPLGLLLLIRITI